jgi:holo-[acyl-carrier protein] synthase
MIYGIGTDIIDIRRLQATLARRGERFAEKVLGEHELAASRPRRPSPRPSAWACACR